MGSALKTCINFSTTQNSNIMDQRAGGPYSGTNEKKSNFETTNRIP